MGMSKFTQETKSEIAEKYKKGADVILLCKEYGISRSYLYRIIKLKRNIEIHIRKPHIPSGI